MKILEPKQTALVEFYSTAKNDIIADQFCFLLSNINYDPFDKNFEETFKEENLIQ